MNKPIPTIYIFSLISQYIYLILKILNFCYKTYILCFLKINVFYENHRNVIQNLDLTIFSRY